MKGAFDPNPPPPREPVMKADVRINRVKVFTSAQMNFKTSVFVTLQEM